MPERANWPTVALGDHVDLLAGYAFKSSGFTDNPQDVPLVKGDNVQQRYIDWAKAKRWPRDQLESLAKFKLMPGDVVLAMDRPWIEAGLKVAWVKTADPQALLVQRVARLRGTNGLSTTYLRYVLCSQAFTDYIRPIVTGINVPHISPSQIRDFKFLLPPENTQRRIASILSAYDDLIENNTRRIAILEEVARRIYEEWFVHFRFPEHEQVKMVESELGLIPEGWNIHSIGEHFELDKGLSYKGSGLGEDGVPMVNLKNFSASGGFRRDGTKPYSGDFKPRHVVTKGDIVIANTDLTQAGTIVGSPALIPSQYSDVCIFSHHLYAVRLRGKEADRRLYWYWLLSSPTFKAFAKGFASGTTVLGLPKEGILGYRIAFPPEQLRDHFVSIVEPIHKLVENLHGKNDNLRATRDLLLPKLISGELDVSSFPEPEAIAA